MRVLLDVTADRSPGHDRGIGRYLAALRDANNLLGNDVEEVVCTTGPSRLAEFAAMYRRKRALRGSDFDVFHAPTPYYAAKDPRDRPTVASILDVIPLDLHEHRRTGLKARFFYRLAGQADAVLTLSRHAASRIEVVIGVDPRRIVVAPLPPAPAFSRFGPSAPGLPKPYVAMLLDLRTPDPRKRSHWIPKLAANLAPQGISLVVGGGGTEHLQIRGVHGLGRVHDDSWASILRGAELFVYTSAYEGQGLPPLEAIACGTPVLGMNNTAIPEVVGGAGILIDDVAGDDGAARLAAEVLRVVEDQPLLQRLTTACTEQSHHFQLEHFAGQVGRAYDLAAGGLP
jgi:glycosyltransferase involved in cell wall biosynthesis